ncbi:MAG: hypothetical protein JW889_15365 [Verrucomicrobia bacterium]|nr:hypothetical protein [Verrucomicrobiota bacterium]
MRPILLLTATALILAPGCGRPREMAAPRHEVERSFRSDDGAVELTLRIDKSELSIADSFRCVIELKRGKEVAAEIPAFADLEQAFTPLVVRDRRDMPERIEDGTVIEAQEYELEPLVSGDYTIKPFTLTYTSADTEHTLETEPIVLKVTSLGAGDPRAELRDIAGPVEIRMARSRFWLWLALGAAVALAGALVVLVRRRRHETVAPRVRSAYEIAFDALRELRERDYVGRGMVKEFYIELSAILRWYIENRFGLHAPEQTTEEFLAAISSDGHFDLRRRSLLTEFLGHCDLVKFAKYGPTPGEIQGAFTTAATFIDETKEAPANAV